MSMLYDKPCLMSILFSNGDGPKKLWRMNLVFIMISSIGWDSKTKSLFKLRKPIDILFSPFCPLSGLFIRYIYGNSTILSWKWQQKTHRVSNFLMSNKSWSPQMMKTILFWSTVTFCIVQSFLNNSWQFMVFNIVIRYSCVKHFWTTKQRLLIQIF